MSVNTLVGPHFSSYSLPAEKITEQNVEIPVGGVTFSTDILDFYESQDGFEAYGVVNKDGDEQTMFVKLGKDLMGVWEEQIVDDDGNIEVASKGVVHFFFCYDGISTFTGYWTDEDNLSGFWRLIKK